MAITPEQDHKITELYLEMFQMLFQYAKTALGNPSFAEEAVQDTFRIACANPEACLNSPNPRGWLLETLKNVIRNMRRSFDRRQKLTDRLISIADISETAEAFDPADDLSALKNLCITVLGENDFHLFWRVTMDHLTMAEAAVEFGIHTETCKKRIQRARIKLQNYIKIFCQDLSPQAACRTYTE